MKLLFILATLLSVAPVKSSKIYHKDWIDFNKNGVKDVYEDPSADIDARVNDLLSQMTLEEKTCQMVTLYGYRRVLKDQLPAPQWQEQIWKDGIGAIDEHLNSFVGWSVPLSTESPRKYGSNRPS
jgi:beta-glucosidase